VTGSEGTDAICTEIEIMVGAMEAGQTGARGSGGRGGGGGAVRCRAEDDVTSDDVTPTTASDVTRTFRTTVPTVLFLQRVRTTASGVTSSGVR
jgi:hypothetical protein